MNTSERIAKWQNKALDEGWRIKSISYGRDGKPMTFGFETWSGYVALAGVAAFFGGVGYAIYCKENGRNPFVGVGVALAGLAFAASSIKLRDHMLKRRWIEKKARCLDREVRCVFPGRDQAWDARVLCEYDSIAGPIRCTPFLSYNGFVSEVSARACVDAHIASDGGCRLLVNPENPLEVKLLKRAAHAVAA